MVNQPKRNKKYKNYPCQLGIACYLLDHDSIKQNRCENILYGPGSNHKKFFDDLKWLDNFKEIYFTFSMKNWIFLALSGALSASSCPKWLCYCCESSTPVSPVDEDLRQKMEEVNSLDFVRITKEQLKEAEKKVEELKKIAHDYQAQGKPIPAELEKILDRTPMAISSTWQNIFWNEDSSVESLLEVRLDAVLELNIDNTSEAELDRTLEEIGELKQIVHQESVGPALGDKVSAMLQKEIDIKHKLQELQSTGSAGTPGSNSRDDAAETHVGNSLKGVEILADGYKKASQEEQARLKPGLLSSIDRVDRLVHGLNQQDHQAFISQISSRLEALRALRTSIAESGTGARSQVDQNPHQTAAQQQALPTKLLGQESDGEASEEEGEGLKISELFQAGIEELAKEEAMPTTEQELREEISKIEKAEEDLASFDLPDKSRLIGELNRKKLKRQTELLKLITPKT